MAVTAEYLRELQGDVANVAWAIQAKAFIPSDLTNLKGRIETIRAVIGDYPDLSHRFTQIDRQFIDLQKTAAAMEEKEEKAPPANTLILMNARQYDMPGNQPSACTFHAIAAQQQIAQNFDGIYQQFLRGESHALSQFQQGVIREGLAEYRRQLAARPDLLQGADLEHIRLPVGLHLEQYRSENLEPFGNRLDRVMNHLSTPGNQTNVVWIKNGNEESFAVIAKSGRFIIFDSHKNEIFAASSLDETRKKLVQKLGPYVNSDVVGNDMTPFDFATGHIDRAPRAAPQTRCCIGTFAAIAFAAAAAGLTWLARIYYPSLL